MKKPLFVALVGAIFGLGLVGQNIAQASTVQNGNLTVTLPESVTISGTELGSSNNPRNCTIKASLDSQAGTTIPLRAGAGVGLVDSTGYTVDSGYAVADVEGLTHLVINMVFHCGNGSGTATLKGPYRFTTTWMSVPGLPFAPDTPVNVTFGSATPTPTPSPTASAIGTSTDPLVSAIEKIAALTSANDDLRLQIASLTSQLAIASKGATTKQDSALKNLTNCYRIAKSIAVSKKGTLPKICLSL